jgi:hypothetical protein
VTRQRKRVTPPNDYDRFWDLAHARGYTILVVRYEADGDDPMLLQVIAVRGGREFMAPSVKDVSQLALSVAGLMEDIEREELV